MGFIINGKPVEEHLSTLNGAVCEVDKGLENQNIGCDDSFEPPQIISDDPIIREHGTCFIKFKLPEEGAGEEGSLLSKLLNCFRK